MPNILWTLLLIYMYMNVLLVEACHSFYSDSDIHLYNINGMCYKIRWGVNYRPAVSTVSSVDNAENVRCIATPANTLLEKMLSKPEMEGFIFWKFYLISIFPFIKSSQTLLNSTTKTSIWLKYKSCVNTLVLGF